MKKLTLLFAMLITMVSSAWADVAPGNYLFKNYRSGKYAVWKGDAAQINHVSNKNQLAAVWIVREDGKLGNQATSNLFATMNSFNATGTPVYFVNSSYNTGYVVIATNTNIESDNPNYCWDASNVNANVATWHHWSTDYEGSSWQIIPVTDEELESIRLTPTYTELKAQAEAAYNSVKSLDNTKLLISESQLSSPYTDPQEGSLAGLVDENPTTFWHSTWRNGNQNPGVHYLEIALPENTVGGIQMTFTRRNVTADQLTKADIIGVNSDNSTEKVTTLNFKNPTAGVTETVIFELPKSYASIRILEQATTSDRGYWHCAGLQFNKAVLYRSSAPTEAAALKVELDKAPELITQQVIDDLQNALNAYSAAIPVDFTVSVVGTDGGGVVYKENTYINGQVLEAPVSLTVADLSAVAVAGYTPDITISTETQSVKVTYYNEYVPALPQDKPYIKVGEKANTITPATSAEDNDHWFVMTQVRDGESPMYDNGTSTIKRAAAGTDVNGKEVSGNEKYLVRFIPTASEGVYNVQFATGKFIQTSLVTGSAKGAGQYFVYNIAGQDTHIGWNKTTDGTTKANIVDNNGAGNTVSFWGTGEITAVGNNNDWSLYSAELVNYTTAELKAVIAKAQSYVGHIGTELGQYQGLAAGDLSAGILVAQSFLGSTDQTEIDEATAALNEALAKLTINKPAANTYLRIKGTTGTKYISGQETADGTKYTRTEDADEALFFFNGTNLQSVSSKKYMAVTGSQWKWSDIDGASTITFVEGTVGKYAILASGATLYDAGDNVDRGRDVNLATADVRYKQWVLEVAETPVPETANMKITAAQWGTFWAPFAVEIPEGVKAYTGEMKGDWIKMTEVEGVIPANTGVVVTSEKLVDLDLPAAESNPAELQTCYTGNTTGSVIVMEQGAYLLQKQDEQVGWYKVSGEGFTLAPNRCYLAKGTVPEAVAESRTFIGFEPVDGDATGISTIASQAATKADGKYMVKGQIVVVKSGKAYNVNGTQIK